MGGPFRSRIALGGFDFSGRLDLAGGVVGQFYRLDDCPAQDSSALTGRNRGTRWRIRTLNIKDRPRRSG
jgi:hypothetical protein